MSIVISSPIRKLGDWVVKALDTSYLALTDGYVQACQSAGGLCRFFCFTDSNNPPTTQRGGGWSHEDWVDTRPGCAMRVKKGHYWKVTKTGAGVNVYWIPDR